jgi:uncharacterized protein YggE
MVVFFAVILAAFIITWINSPLVVSVTGTGEVSVPATSASISLSALAVSPTPLEAINQVKSRVSDLRQTLRSSGIDEKDIVESAVTAVPAAAYTVGASGYQASVTLSAKTADVAGIGNLVSGLYSAGAGVVAQPVLTAEGQEQLEQKAMDMAMQDAKKKAAIMARKNFKFIKKIIAVQQASSGSTATATTKTEAADTEFKLTQAVSVSYKMW